MEKMDGGGFDDSRGHEGLRAPFATGDGADSQIDAPPYDDPNVRRSPNLRGVARALRTRYGAWAEVPDDVRARIADDYGTSVERVGEAYRSADRARFAGQDAAYWSARFAISRAKRFGREIDLHEIAAASHLPLSEVQALVGEVADPAFIDTPPPARPLRWTWASEKIRERNAEARAQEEAIGTAEYFEEAVEKITDRLVASVRAVADGDEAPSPDVKCSKHQYAESLPDGSRLSVFAENYVLSFDAVLRAALRAVTVADGWYDRELAKEVAYAVAGHVVARIKAIPNWSVERRQDAKAIETRRSFTLPVPDDFELN